MKRPNIINPTKNFEVFSKAPLLELTGENRLLIENHHGVLAYSLEEIQIKVSYGKISVIGKNLKIMQMSREQLAIVGRIVEIHLNRR